MRDKLVELDKASRIEQQLDPLAGCELAGLMLFLNASFTATEFAAQGAVLSRDGRSHQGLLALVALENGDDEVTYVAGTRNFYVVTRYNWSSYYALAVIELGQAVARARRVATAQGR